MEKKKKKIKKRKNNRFQNLKIGFSNRFQISKSGFKMDFEICKSMLKPDFQILKSFFFSLFFDFFPFFDLHHTLSTDLVNLIPYLYLNNSEHQKLKFFTLHSFGLLVVHDMHYITSK